MMIDFQHFAFTNGIESHSVLNFGWIPPFSKYLVMQIPKSPTPLLLQNAYTRLMHMNFSLGPSTQNAKRTIIHFTYILHQRTSSDCRFSIQWSETEEMKWTFVSFCCPTNRLICTSINRRWSKKRLISCN